MPTTLNHAQGALIGVHAGDSLGATVEFRSAASIANEYPNGIRDIIGGGPFNWNPGDPTDDTDLTWAICHGYLDANFDHSDVIDAAAERMLAWRNNGPADIGGTTSQGLRNYAGSRNVYTSGITDTNAQANGSLMRTMGVAVARHTNPGVRQAEAALLSAVTHAHPACQNACVAYTNIAADLINGETPETAVNNVIAWLNNDTDGVTDLLAATEEAANGDGTHRYDDLTGPQGGYVYWAYKTAVRAVLTAPDFEEGTVAVIMLGGDTDTNGAIAGGLLGARFGYDAIPERWTSRLGLHDELVGFAETAINR